MYKMGKIKRYFKENDYEHFKMFVRNEIDMRDVREELNATNQLVSYVVNQIDPDAFDKRRNDINQRLRVIYDMLMEGVSMDRVLEDDVMIPFNKTHRSNDINGRKDSIASLIKRHEVYDDPDFRRRITINNKLANYVNILEIENEILATPPEKLNLYRMAIKYGVSYSKVLERNRNLRRHGRTLTTVNDTLYHTMKRNIDIATAYKKGESIYGIKESYPDVRYIEMIIDSYEPFIKGVN